MFRKIIENTQFTSDIANEMFPNISGGVYQGDVSFLATMRALLAPRMKDEDRINIAFGVASHSKEVYQDYKANDVFRGIGDANGVSDPGRYAIISVRGRKEDNEATFSAIDKGFTETYPKFKKFEKVTAFFRKSFAASCFINEEDKSVVLFVESLDVRKLHYLQMAILPSLPWYFNAKEGLSEDELALVYALKETTHDKYMECLAKLAAKYNFRDAQIRKMLKGFEHRFDKVEIERLESMLEDLRERILAYNSEIGSAMQEIDSANTRLMGLKLKTGDDDETSELMEYFLHNKNLYLQNVTDRAIVFTVLDYLSFYDQDMARRMIDNTDSFLYRDSEHGDRAFTSIKPEKMKKLLTAIFLDEKLRMKFCAAYKFVLGGNVEPMSGWTYPVECSESMPNPHIDRWRCMGNYSRIINEILSRNDYIGAITQCAASCQSLNWGDSAVMRTFIHTMYDTESPRRCIELPDGKTVTPAEAIEWLEKQEAADEKKEED